MSTVTAQTQRRAAAVARLDAYLTTHTTQTLRLLLSCMNGQPVASDSLSDAVNVANARREIAWSPVDINVARAAVVRALASRKDA